VTRCEEIQPLLYPWLDEELGAERAALVAAHLEACPECGRRAAAERRFLERISEAGRETAPAGLRARVEEILAGRDVPRDRVAPVAPVRPPWRRWLVPAIAAAAVLLLVLRPWGGTPPAARAASFAADADAHAALAPSGSPFPAGVQVPAPPELPGARLAGLSECVVDGISYAHYTFWMGDRLVSIFLPMEDAVLPEPGAARAGATSVVSVAAAGDLPPAVLVSGDMKPDELRALWPGA
jgi:anti-sigma factor (TIGR02949 family)